MIRTIFLDGAFLAEEDARISVMDRGFLFGDAIYEVTAMVDGHLIDNDLHLARLKRSLAEIGIEMPMPAEKIRDMQVELVRRNGMTDGTIYLQVSRGVAERSFLFSAELRPTFVAFTQAKKLYDTPAQRDGISVDLQPDPRWNRRDIKTVMLLGQVLAKDRGTAKGFGDVWLHEEGHVTEGASSTAFIVTKDGRIVTRPNSHAILPGCTRRAVLDLIAQEDDLVFEERPITLEELGEVAEAFLTSASSLVTPVTRIGDTVIAGGKPGPVTRKLQAHYLRAARSCEKIA